MKKIMSSLLIILSIITNAQENPNNGFLPSRVTTTARNGFTNPAKGLIIFNTTTNSLEINTGTGAAPVWSTLLAVASGSSLNPMFSASNAVNQSFSFSTVQVDFGNETIDTNNNFATNRFTPTVSGKYYINAGLTVSGFNCTGCSWNIYIYKNGSVYSSNKQSTFASNTQNLNISDVIQMNGTTDYLEIYVAGYPGTLDAGYSSFKGFLIKE